jgi:hypothetical protein
MRIIVVGPLLSVAPNPDDPTTRPAYHSLIESIFYHEKTVIGCCLQLVDKGASVGSVVDMVQRRPLRFAWWIYRGSSVR